MGNQFKQDVEWTIEDLKQIVIQTGIILRNVNERLTIIESVVTNLALNTKVGQRVLSQMSAEMQTGRNDKLPPLKN